MKKLSVEFTKNGFNYILLSRSNQVALFELKKYGASRGFEVVKIKTQGPQTKTIEGRTLETPARESLPGAEAFGTTGFSYMANQWEQAKARFRSMVDHHEKTSP